MSDQDDRAQRLLSPLREEPAGPPRFDVGRAIIAGRRRRRLRQWSVTAAASVVTLVAVGGGIAAAGGVRSKEEAAPPVTGERTAPCPMTVLPTDGIKKALVTGGDPTGRYLAGRIYPPGEGVRTVIWRDGKMVTRNSMPGSDPSIDDLNSTGIGVGTSFGTAEHPMAFVFRDGRFRGLPGHDPSAAAINDAGLIVGSAGPGSGRYPVSWELSSTAPERLPLPAGADTGVARMVDEDGTIVGTVAKGAEEGTGFLWRPDGTARAMPMPEVGGRKASSFWPESIRHGRVAGRAVFEEKDGTTFTSVVYDVRTNAYRSLATDFGPPALIADDGAVLGVTGSTPSIVTGDATLDLPVDLGKEYQVNVFSGDGRVAAGYSVTTDEKVSNEPVVWHCR